MVRKYGHFWCENRDVLVSKVYSFLVREYHLFGAQVRAFLVRKYKFSVGKY